MNAPLRMVTDHKELEHQYQDVVAKFYRRRVQALDLRSWRQRSLEDRLQWALESVSLLRELGARRNDWKVFVDKHLGNFEEHANLLYGELDRRIELRHRRELRIFIRATFVLALIGALLATNGFQPVARLLDWGRAPVLAFWEAFR